MARDIFSGWRDGDVRELIRLMRRFADAVTQGD
jgi:hypothetical protein